MAGFKYFAFDGAATLTVEVSGRGEGTICASTDRDFTSVAATVPLNLQGKRQTLTVPLQVEKGTRPLYFRYQGKGAINFYNFTLA